MTNQTDPIVIIAAKRTAMGAFQGGLSAVTAPELGASAIKSVLDDAKCDADKIDDVIMGCVLSAGLGQAPARQASIKSGLPTSTTATTINKMCGSGMKSVMMACDTILAGNANIMIAGGMESMTNAPYILDKARDGYRMGHGKITDHMFFDGLQDAYEGHLMGHFADETADKQNITREEQDNFAIESLKRASKAIETGAFKNEITPVTIETRKGDIVFDTDESPAKAMPEKIPKLRPAFNKDGTVTAANASSISDGAAALLLMRKSEAEKQGFGILAEIKSYASHGQKPSEFTIAPISAMEKALAKANWTLDDVDLFEINEAFAVVTLAAIKNLNLPSEKVNINGGACALGHPIGASGARILVTLIHALKHKNLKRGMASLCIGGGEATALCLEIN